MTNTQTDVNRRQLLRRGFALEYVTLSWNVVGIVVLAIAAVSARSVALAGFQNSGHGENIQLIGEARKHRHLAKPRCIAAGQRLAGSQVEL